MVYLKKGVRALRGFFGPPMTLKMESCFSQVINTIVQVLKSGIDSILTVAMVTRRTIAPFCFWLQRGPYLPLNARSSFANLYILIVPSHCY